MLLRRQASCSFPIETYALDRVQLRCIECGQFLNAQSILRHTASNCVAATSGKLLVSERDLCSRLCVETGRIYRHTASNCVAETSGELLVSERDEFS